LDISKAKQYITLERKIIKKTLGLPQNNVGNTAK